MDQIDDILDQDIDPTETREWMDSLNAVMNHDGTERAHFLLEKMVDTTRRSGGYLPFDPTTAYVNTIPPNQQAKSPGDAAHGVAHPLDDPLERDGDGGAHQPQAGRAWVGTSPVSLRRRRCTTSASTISGARRPPTIRAT